MIFEKQVGDKTVSGIEGELQKRYEQKEDNMAKILCKCGHILSDSTDYLSYKGYTT